jgi:hypothetical protein
LAHFRRLDAFGAAKSSRVANDQTADNGFAGLTLHQRACVQAHAIFINSKPQRGLRRRK